MHGTHVPPYSSDAQQSLVRLEASAPLLPIGVALKEALERPSGGKDVGCVLDEHVEELLLARNERESHVSRCGGPAELGRPPR